jgi:hypothetical protein
MMSPSRRPCEPWVPFISANLTLGISVQDNTNDSGDIGIIPASKFSNAQPWAHASSSCLGSRSLSFPNPCREAVRPPAREHIGPRAAAAIVNLVDRWQGCPAHALFL